MGLVYLKEERNFTKIGIWRVEESIEDLKSRLLLNSEEINFYNSLNKGKRNIHWLSSRVLLRKLLNTEKFIDVRGDKYGKPHLINFNYELSITHSFDYAAVIISKNKVGIDIESIKPVIKKIAPRFMHQSELRHIDIQNDIKKLYVYWCAKETIYKLYGKRELSFRDHIIVDDFQYNSKGIAKARIEKDDINCSFEIVYEDFFGYMFTYAIKT
jgi:4'-phosphopantetheinyl transferase